MTTRMQKIAGGVWALMALGLLAQEIWELLQDRFLLSAGYYVIVWGAFVLAIIGGTAVAFGYPSGRWLILLTATLAALQQLWVALAYGTESPSLWPQALGIIAFAIAVSVVVLRGQPNPTVDPDARRSGARGSP